ncbi:MAG TPA: phage tail protein [Candidatus Binatia bacterium]|nr:phage tail protein [Candidatus Binatia bacterium]
MLRIKTRGFLPGHQTSGTDETALWVEGKALSYYRPLHLGKTNCFVVWNGVSVRGDAVDVICPGPCDELIFIPEIGYEIVVVLAYLAAIWAYIGPYVIAAVVSTALSYAIQALIGEPDTSNDTDPGGLFDRFRNGTKRGTPIPVPYGEPRVPGQVLNVVARSDEQGNTFLDVLLGLGQGPVQGIGDLVGEFNNKAHDDPDLESIRLNENALSSYPGVTVSFRPGELHQSVIPGFHEVHNVRSNSQALTQPLYAWSNDPGEGPGPWRRHTTAGDVDRANLRISFPAGCYYVADSGEVKPFEAFYDVRYRIYDVGGGTPGDWQYIRWNRQTKAYTVTAVEDDALPVWVRTKRQAPFTSELMLTLERNRYDIDVRRRNRSQQSVSDSDWSRHAPSKRNNDMIFSAVDEILEIALSYPCIALIAFKGIDVRQTNGSLPDVTLLLKGRKVPIWDGVDPAAPVFAHKWTDNPAWHLYDVCSNTRYSIGNYLDRATPGLESLKELADHADELVDDGRGGTEPRFRFDDLIGQMPAWEVLRRIGQTCRTAPIVSEREIRFKTEKPRTSSQHMHMGTITEGTWEMGFVNTAEAANQVIVQYRNRERDHKDDAAIIDMIEYLDAGEPLVTRTVPLPGITRPGQAHREAKFIGYLGKLGYMRASHTVGLSALAAEAGDVVTGVHDVPNTGFSGRLAAGCTADSVILDRSMILEEGKVYEIDVMFGANDQRATVEISSPAGTYAKGDSIELASDLPRAPAHHDLYVIYEQALGLQDWIIGRISRAQDLSRKVELINYDPELFEIADTLGHILDAPGTVIPNAATRFPSAVTDVSLTADVGIGVDGSARSGLRVHWTPALEKAAGRYEIFVRDTDDLHWESAGRVTGVEAFVARDLVAGTSYDVAVVGVAETGDRAHPENSPQATLVYQPVSQRPLPPVDLVVTGGDALYLEWSDPPVDAEGQPRNRNLRVYEVRRGIEWRTGVKVAETRGTSVQLPVWARGEHLIVKAIDTYGQESETAAGIYVTIPPKHSSSIVLDRSERDLGWPGLKIQCAVDAYGRLEADAGLAAAEYLVQGVDLGEDRDWQYMLCCSPTQRGLNFTYDVVKLPIGAIDGDGFAENELVTGGTSGATGRVVVAVTAPSIHLYLRPVSGTFIADEDLVGGSSATTATALAGPVSPSFDDLEVATWTMAGRGRDNHLAATTVEITASDNYAVNPMLLRTRQGIFHGRFLDLNVSLRTDDAAAYQTVVDDMRLIVWPHTM